ncbi:lysophospholipid acyltransferase family protein [Lichenicoccus roseus]|uniref:Acyltransferase n=1 Tax=Lichenicoccus roseus TaxID=2683649 RepID=A0A5R9J6B2_9PROT|nr:lysophospholipid acyltransferase family protein [Lichenicoccus roseus]TLU73154.1 acyltransferase [Lichenicoccus roseus]
MASGSDPVALRSEPLFRLFASYLRFSFSRSFHAVRLSGALPAWPPQQPVIVYSNHPSWWDPALFILVTDQMFRGRPCFGPMDAASLERYGFFQRLGVFGIEKSSLQGARRFLQVSRDVLTRSRGPAGRGMVWITAEGGFTDPRSRPITLRPGIAHLARSMPDALLVPLAIEYGFWNESRPEAMIRFGTPMVADAGLRTAEWTLRLQGALSAEMDALALDAMSRDSARFQRVLRGRNGVSLPYDLYRRLRALLAGRPFSPAHEEEA